MMLKFTLPIPPSVNHYYIRGRRGMVFKSSQANKWLSDAHTEIIVAISKQGWFRSKDKKVVVDITVRWKDNRRRDCDNLLKPLLDSMNGLVFDDDRFALPRFADWSVDKENPGIDVVCSLFDA